MTEEINGVRVLRKIDGFDNAPPGYIEVAFRLAQGEFGAISREVVPLHMMEDRLFWEHFVGVVVKGNLEREIEKAKRKASRLTVFEWQDGSRPSGPQTVEAETVEAAALLAANGESCYVWLRGVGEPLYRAYFVHNSGKVEKRPFVTPDPVATRAEQDGPLGPGEAV